MSELKRFGRRLRRFINRPDVFEILAEGDWGAGGCWILAEALVQWLGPPARLVAVASSKLPVEHIAVEYIDLYIDYQGAQTEDEFLSHLEADGIDRPRIVEFAKYLQVKARRSGIPCDVYQVRQLISKLNTHFGSAR